MFLLSGNGLLQVFHFLKDKENRTGNLLYIYKFQMSIMNRIILVTGATAGFGRAIAEKFASGGWDVIITGRRKERLDDLEKNLLASGNRVLSLNFDVRSLAEVEKALGDLPPEWQDIDVLVNNAGLASGLSHIDEGDIDDWEKMIDTNVKGLLYVTRVVAPLMVRRKSGHIINMGSIAGIEAYENGNVYCATKAAVGSLSRTMRIDLLKHNIKVTNIAPGMADTEFSVVRFRGNEEKAREVYKGIEALTGEDIADVVFYCATLPAHVCINELVITPTQQAGVNHNFRKH
jgi:3-hydroxy acid dehydrogenase / malonic semialdehyde reductase